MNLRPDLQVCSRIEDVRDEDRPAVASDPALSEALAEAGVTDPGAQAALRRAAGDYTRTMQAIERAFGINRDIDQSGHNRVLCERQQEIVDVVNRHNAGAEP
ncbi:MAG: hypothetical protein ACREH4_06460 [Vitreimonas sp.]